MNKTFAMIPSVASCEHPFRGYLGLETMLLTVPISLLERTSWHKPLMNLSEEVMLRIFTYHQVSPCYLNFIACFGSRTGASDLRFGGFRSIASSDNPAALRLRVSIAAASTINSPSTYEESRWIRKRDQFKPQAPRVPTSTGTLLQLSIINST